MYSTLQAESDKHSTQSRFSIRIPLLELCFKNYVPHLEIPSLLLPYIQSQASLQGFIKNHLTSSYKSSSSRSPSSEFSVLFCFKIRKPQIFFWVDVCVEPLCQCIFPRTLLGISFINQCIFWQVLPSSPPGAP